MNYGCYTYMKAFTRGLTDGIPIGTGYFSVAFTFGISAVSQGMSWWQALIISMTNLTSAGQFSGLGIMCAGGSYFEMAVTQLVINMRYALMSVALSQKADKKFTAPYRALLSFGNTDEIFAVASGNKSIGKEYFFGLTVIPYIGWSGGTLAGAVCGNILPGFIINALGIAIYCMFIAIIVPALREKGVPAVAAVSAVISCIFYYVPFFRFISSGFSIILCAVIAAAAGAVLYPVKEDFHDD